MLLHDREELDDDLGRRSDKHLALTLALGVDNAVEGVVLFAINRRRRNEVSSSPHSNCDNRCIGGRLTRTEMRTMVGDYVIYWAGTGIGTKRWTGVGG